jgi:hypothetical protein
MQTLTDILRGFEARLMDPRIRRSSEAADLIADDFVEFGASGRLHNKADALAMMRHHTPRIHSLEDFHVRELSDKVALVTYRVQSQSVDGGPGRTSVRSSIWIQREGKWQVTFHQATMI